jgi:hypothetical protein
MYSCLSTKSIYVNSKVGLKIISDYDCSVFIIFSRTRWIFHCHYSNALDSYPPSVKIDR